ncbi:hypothetical protein ABZ912_02345 [Nonomuraea angiospora]|uniref:hypothetical protein n=1 Tax=Nonomuraea angiospora TaxID=46172 RepID=UPI0033EE0975
MQHQPTTPSEAHLGGHQVVGQVQPSIGPSVRACPDSTSELPGPERLLPDVLSADVLGRESDR